MGRAEPVLQPAMVVPNIVRAFQGGLHSLCTPLLLFRLSSLIFAMKNSILMSQAPVLRDLVTFHIILLGGVGVTIYNTHTLKPFKELVLDSQRGICVP